MMHRVVVQADRGGFPVVANGDEDRSQQRPGVEARQGAQRQVQARAVIDQTQDGVRVCVAVAQRGGVEAPYGVVRYGRWQAMLSLLLLMQRAVGVLRAGRAPRSDRPIRQ